MLGDKETILDKMILWAVLGLLGWNVMSTQNLTVTTAVMSAEIIALKLVISEGNVERYTKSMARSDQALIDQRLTRLEQWNQNLSDRMKKLEGSLIGGGE